MLRQQLTEQEQEEQQQRQLRKTNVKEGKATSSSTDGNDHVAGADDVDVDDNVQVIVNQRNLDSSSSPNNTGRENHHNDNISDNIVHHENNNEEEEDGISIERDDDEVDGNDDEDSEFSYDTEEDDDEEDGDDDEDDEDDEDGDDDDQDNNRDLYMDDDDEENQSNTSNQCLCCHPNPHHKRRQNHTKFNSGSNIVSNQNGNDDDDDDDDEIISNQQGIDEEEEKQQQEQDDDLLENSNHGWKIIFQPVLSPIIKVYQVAKEAFILITNVDDVWDSPALERRDYINDDEIMYRSRSEIDHNDHHPIRIQTSTITTPTMTTTASNSSTFLLNNNNNQNNYDGSSTIINGGMSRVERRGGGQGGKDEPSTRWNQLHSSEHDRLIRGEFDPNFPNRNVDSHIESTTPDTNIGQYVSFRHKVGVLFWFLVLAIAYACERGTFKIMVDRMGPFRMVVGAEFVMGVHAIILAVWILLRKLICGRDDVKGTVMLPWVDVGIMAVLDSIQLLIAVISGSRVAPILTAVLVHFTIPVSTFLKHIIDKNSAHDPYADTSLIPQNLFGSTLIFISSVLALSPAILTLIYPTLFSSKNVMANRTAWNTLLFTTSCIPAALSQIYKERTLAGFAQPVDSTLLNMLLSLNSFAFTFLVSPLVFSLQGFADIPSTPEEGSVLKVASWIHQYPSKEISSNFAQSLQCFTGTLSDDVQIREYPEEAHCDFAYGFVLMYVFSILTINHAIDKICNAGAIKIMHKGISAGIIMSVVMMAYYQIFVDDEEYGLIPNFYHVSCAAVLVFGSEVYHRVNLEKPSFETEYHQIADLYDEDDV